MDDSGFLDALRRESVALVAAAEGRLLAPIPAVDGWTVGEVVVHVGQGNEWVRHIIADGLDGGKALEALEADPAIGDDEDEAALLDWFAAGARRLSDTFTALDPRARGWTLDDPDGPLSGWLRRRAQEVAVHRWDVDSASGSPAPIGAALAVDGIDEVFEFFVPRIATETLAGDGETLHLHATDEDLPDGEGEWTIRFGAEGLSVERGHAKGDAAVRGSASELLLLLWNRIPPIRLEVFGDVAVVDGWRRRFQF
jgi:uncharacterized protein (TIGR03083 family)